MGRMKEHPRYNVVSFRLSDDELKQLEAFRGGRTRQDAIILIISGVFNKREGPEHASTANSGT